MAYVERVFINGFGHRCSEVQEYVFVSNYIPLH